MVRKRYHPPATPHQRLLADARVPEEVRSRVAAMATELDPVRLLAEIRKAQARLVEIADSADVGEGLRPNQPTLEEFLAGLRTAWREGEARPTAKPKPTAKRGRRRPDPLAVVTTQLHEWFMAAPWRTSRELLIRLQTEIPDAHPETLLRTLQRRVKGWRAELAHRMVFGPAIGPDAMEEHEATGAASAATDMPG